MRNLVRVRWQLKNTLLADTLMAWVSSMREQSMPEFNYIKIPLNRKHIRLYFSLALSRWKLVSFHHDVIFLRYFCSIAGKKGMTWTLFCDEQTSTPLYINFAIVLTVTMSGKTTENVEVAINSANFDTVKRWTGSGAVRNSCLTATFSKVEKWVDRRRGGYLQPNLDRRLFWMTPYEQEDFRGCYLARRTFEAFKSLIGLISYLDGFD